MDYTELTITEAMWPLRTENISGIAAIDPVAMQAKEHAWDKILGALDADACTGNQYWRMALADEFTNPEKLRGYDHSVWPDDMRQCRRLASHLIDFASTDETSGANATATVNALLNARPYMRDIVYHDLAARTPVPTRPFIGLLAGMAESGIIDGNEKRQRDVLCVFNRMAPARTMDAVQSAVAVKTALLRRGTSARVRDLARAGLTL